MANFKEHKEFLDKLAPKEWLEREAKKRNDKISEIKTAWIEKQLEKVSEIETDGGAVKKGKKDSKDNKTALNAMKQQLEEQF